MTQRHDRISNPGHGRILCGDDIGSAAIEYALNGWEIFPLAGKVPAIGNPHPKGSRERRECHGECGRDGHGLHDATSDVNKVVGWWGGPYRGFNIGLRPPETMFVLDSDPRNGGNETIAKLAAEGVTIPDAFGAWSGRGDGGRHWYFRKPSTELTTSHLPGLDIKDRSGYVVAPPSRHPDTGDPYQSIEGDIVIPGYALIRAMTPPPKPAPKPRRRLGQWALTGTSVADQFCLTATWDDILGPAGWRCISADSEGEDAHWLHPNATSSLSAKTRYGCLFVFSTNTPFTPTSAGSANGYTKFRAYALLHYNGNMAAAARSLVHKEAS